MSKQPRFTERLAVSGLRADEGHQYECFARAAWGARSSQAQRQRLEWLYSNPLSKGMENDLLVLRADGKIVGAHHRMRIPWNLGAHRVAVPSLHDLYVLDEFRAGGGFLLIKAALSNEPSVLLAGLSPAADAMYARMKVPSVPCYWQVKVFDYARMAFSLLARGFGRRKPLRLFTPGEIVIDGMRCEFDHGSSEVMEEALKLPGGNGPSWDSASYRWRFFHPDGPRSVLVTARKNGAVAARAVVSLGYRRGVPVARLVDMAGEEDCYPALLTAVEHLIRHCHAAVGLSATTSRRASELMAARGWKHREPAPGVRFFSRDAIDAANLQIWGGAWDFGLDEQG